MAARAHYWLMVNLSPTRTAALQQVHPKPVLVHGVVPPQVQDPALIPLELHWVPLCPTLQPVQLSLDGSTACRCITRRYTPSVPCSWCPSYWPYCSCCPSFPVFLVPCVLHSVHPAPAVPRSQSPSFLVSLILAILLLLSLVPIVPHSWCPSYWSSGSCCPSVLGSARTGLIFTGLQEGAQPGGGG